MLSISKKMHILKALLLKCCIHSLTPSSSLDFLVDATMTQMSSSKRSRSEFPSNRDESGMIRK